MRNNIMFISLEKLEPFKIWWFVFCPCFWEIVNNSLYCYKLSWSKVYSSISDYNNELSIQTPAGVHGLLACGTTPTFHLSFCFCFFRNSSTFLFKNFIVLQSSSLISIKLRLRSISILYFFPPSNSM